MHFVTLRGYENIISIFTNSKGVFVHPSVLIKYTYTNTRRNTKNDKAR